MTWVALIHNEYKDVVLIPSTRFLFAYFSTSYIIHTQIRITYDNHEFFRRQVIFCNYSLNF